MRASPRADDMRPRPRRAAGLPEVQEGWQAPGCNAAPACPALAPAAAAGKLNAKLKTDFRCYPNNGHAATASAGPFCAMNRHARFQPAARKRHPSPCEIFAQYLSQTVGIGLRRHEAEILAVAAHQVDDARMVDRIVLAPFVRNFRVERLVEIGDCSNLLRCTGKADKTAMEG